MKLVLVRHGQTDWNIGKLAQGQCGIPLNATGIKQANEARDKLAGYDFNARYSSPLSRAAETAKIICGDQPIIYDDLLKERAFGEYEGTDPKTWDFDSHDLKTNYGEKGFEPISDLMARSLLFLEKLRRNHRPTDTILIVSHGGFLKALYHNATGYDEDTDLWSWHLGNGEIYELDFN